LSLFWPTAMIRPKSQNFKIGHDGSLSIGNFILMIKNHILIFQLPGTRPTTKKCAPFFRGNTEFPIYSNNLTAAAKLFKNFTDVGFFLCGFYLPHMEYEGSIGFVLRKLKKNYCCFSRFRTFYGLKT
jgi:hypothetical protein